MNISRVTEAVGEAHREVSKSLDKAWTKMIETFKKNDKAAKTRIEQNPEVLGNQTNAALKRNQREELTELTGVTTPSENLTSRLADRAIKGHIQEV